MRVLAAGLAVLLGVYLSHCKTYRLKRREQVLNSIFRCICRLENNVCYYREPLSRALKKSDDEVKGFFSTIGDAVERCVLDSSREMWLQAMSSREEFGYLTECDKSILLDFASLLGQSDGYSQKNLFAAFKKQLNENISEARADIDKNVKLYRVLGFAGGVALAIIII
ncbi:MAG TPA: stage III sporulation protein AB [Clostridia bacterium]|mgnify:CR=1 FL=1|nr:stage III sporulation protein AB [Clostridia bacterium]